MSLTGLSQFDTTIHATNTWLKDLMERLGWEDRHRAYQAFRAVLHALRDHLTVDEVATLGAQLPLLIRGIYYEGWHPADKPLRERKKEESAARCASRSATSRWRCRRASPRTRSAPSTTTAS